MTQPAETTAAALPAENTPVEAAPEGVADSFATNSVRTQRDDLIEAAIGSKAELPEPQATTDGEPAKDLAKAKPEAIAEEPRTISHIAKVLQERKEKQRERIAREESRSEATAKVEAERATFAQQQAQLAQERQQVAAERERLMATAKDPFKIAELTGKSHADLANDLAMAGSPEWQLSQRIQSQLEALKEQQAQQSRAWDQHQQALKAQAEQASMQTQIATERSFIDHSGNAETYPHFARLEPDERLAFGYHTAKKYYDATGKVASDKEIAEYYESRFSGESDTQVGTSSQSKTNGNATKVKANAPRTLSNSVASERRSSPKAPSNDLRGEDLRKELVAAAKEAAATTP